MAWFKVLAWVCEKLGRRRIIYDREEKRPYLIRYYLLNTRWIAPYFPKLSFNLTLHNTLRSDEDGLHDHPWDWKSKLLAGGYWEDTPDGRFWRDKRQGWRSRTKDDFHRLVLDPDYAESQGQGRETWSLFFMGPREKDWGFLASDGAWVQWEEYIRNRQSYVLA